MSPRSGQPSGTSKKVRVRVLVVDHSDVVRRGIRSLLSEVDTVAVVGDTASASEALDLVRTTRPQLVLLDAGLSAHSAFALSRAIASDPLPHALVVMLSSVEDVEQALEAFAAGVSGYIARDACIEELLAAIDRTLRGETSVDPILGARLLQAVSRGPAALVDRPAPLTTRESDVIRLLAVGKTNKEIASGLTMALGTVKVHIERIFGKLGTSTRSETAVRAIELGLVEPPGRTLDHRETVQEPLHY